MKIMIASDIHGSAFFCRKLIEKFHEEIPEKLILLGDILYHGPRNELPREYDCAETANLLNSVKDKILCIRGNCDADVDISLLQFPVLTKNLMIFIDGKNIFATHGDKFNGENLPPMNPGDFLLHGHTHVPAISDNGNYTYLNPGSVSIPKEGSVNSYMIIDGGKIEIKELI